MTERKLATIREVSGVTPIEGADFIVSYQIDGWNVIDKKDVYSVGDKVIYLEVDSFVPHDLAPFLAQGKEPDEFNGVKGKRLRTKKMKGVISQGLLLPLTVMGNEYYIDRSSKNLPNCWVKKVNDVFCGANDKVDSNVTQYLGIQKWEAPENKFVVGNQKGNFPYFIPKTDQDRVQNISKSLFSRTAIEPVRFQITEKLHGSSMTIYVKDGEFGVCSRNFEIKQEDDSSFMRCVNAHKLKEKLFSYYEKYGENIAVQGELCGTGINGNQYNINGYKFFVFDVYSIKNKEYFLTLNTEMWCEEFSFDHVPILGYEILQQGFDMQQIQDWVKDQINAADGESTLNKSKREGFVYKDMNSDFSFKVISNAWLLKNE